MTDPNTPIERRRDAVETDLATPTSPSPSNVPVVPVPASSAVVTDMPLPVARRIGGPGSGEAPNPYQALEVVHQPGLPIFPLRPRLPRSENGPAVWNAGPRRKPPRPITVAGKVRPPLRTDPPVVPRLFTFRGHHTHTPDRLMRGEPFFLPNQSDTARHVGNANICGPLALCIGAGFPLTSWQAFTTFIATHMPDDLEGIAAGATDDQLFRFGNTALRLRDIELVNLTGYAAANIRTTSDGFRVPNATVADFVGRVGQRFVVAVDNHWTGYRQYIDDDGEAGWCRLDGLDGSATDIGNAQALDQHLEELLARQVRRGPGYGISLIAWHPLPESAALANDTLLYQSPVVRGHWLSAKPGLPAELLNAITQHLTQEQIVAALINPGLTSVPTASMRIRESVQQLENSPQLLLEFLRAYPDRPSFRGGADISTSSREPGWLPARSELINTSLGLPHTHPAYSKQLLQLGSTRAYEMASQAMQWLEQRLGRFHNVMDRNIMMGIHRPTVLIDATIRLALVLPHLLVLDFARMRLESTFVARPDDTGAGPLPLPLSQRALRLIMDEIGTHALGQSSRGNELLLALTQSAANMVAFLTSSVIDELRHPANDSELNLVMQCWEDVLHGLHDALVARRQARPNDAARVAEDVKVLACTARAMPAACRFHRLLEQGAVNPDAARVDPFDLLAARFERYAGSIVAQLDPAQRLELFDGLIDALVRGSGDSGQTPAMQRLLMQVHDAIVAHGTSQEMDRMIGMALRGLLLYVSADNAETLDAMTLGSAFHEQRGEALPFVNSAVSAAARMRAVAVGMLLWPMETMQPFVRVAIAEHGVDGTKELARLLARCIETADQRLLCTIFGEEGRPESLPLLGQIMQGMEDPDIRHDRVLTRLLGVLPSCDDGGGGENEPVIQRQIAVRSVRVLRAMLGPASANDGKSLPRLEHEQIADILAVLVSNTSFDVVNEDDILEAIEQLDPFAIAIVLRGAAERLPTLVDEEAEFYQRALELLDQIPANATIPVMTALAASLPNAVFAHAGVALMEIFIGGMQRLRMEGFHEAREEVRATFRVNLFNLTEATPGETIAQVRHFGRLLYLMPADMQRDWFDATVHLATQFAGSEWDEADRNAAGLLLDGYLDTVADPDVRAELAQRAPAFLRLQSPARLATIAGIHREIFRFDNASTLSALQQSLSPAGQAHENPSDRTAITLNVMCSHWRAALGSVGPHTDQYGVTTFTFFGMHLDTLPYRLRDAWFDCAVGLMTPERNRNLEPAAREELTTGMAHYLDGIDDDGVRLRKFRMILPAWRDDVRDRMRGPGA